MQSSSRRSVVSAGASVRALEGVHVLPFGVTVLLPPKMYPQ
jgi:hypothetical protein